MAKPSKCIKPIVAFAWSHYVFDSVDQAANAIKFFSKLRPVEYDSGDGTGGHYRPVEDEEKRDRYKVEMDQREFRETPTRIALPAPKRGTVQCAVCESVSVKPGHACASCGAIAELL